jgi:mycoredoxin
VAESPAVTAGESSATPDVIMYTTTWCGYCKRLKRMMQDDGINFAEVDIETTPGTAEIVERVNNGNQTVPTLVFVDGSAMTNPSLARVKEKLASLAA